LADLSEHLEELLQHALHAPEPDASLRALKALRGELDTFERVQVWRALEGGSSFGDIARALGISRQAAHRRYRELAGATEPPGRVRISPEARAAVQLAGEEAVALGAPRVGSEHLLLGILRVGDERAAGALKAEGVSITAARACAEPTVGDTDRAPGDAVTAYAREVLGAALRHAASDDGGVIDVADLLVAALERPGGGACRTLEALGVSADAVRARLRG
jgi:Clp amino terminal domain, pathogenicity island component